MTVSLYTHQFIYGAIKQFLVLVEVATCCASWFEQKDTGHMAEIHSDRRAQHVWDSRPSGATGAGFDLHSHCRLFCVLGLLSARHRIHLECPVPLPPLKDQVSLFKAEGAL